MPPLQNWAGTVRFQPKEVHRPRTVDDLAALLSEGPLRVGGSLHSWSEAARSEGRYARLDGLDKVLEIDRYGREVRVEAGCTLASLCAALDAAGMSLPILGSVTAQTIAGAVSTGTHGSSLVHGNLASLVRGLTLVDGQGRVVTLDRRHPDLPAARVSLGAMGVLTELRLAVEPAFDLVEELTPVPFDAACEELERYARGAEYAKLWWLPFTDEVLVFLAARREAAGDLPATRQSPGERWVDEKVTNALVFPALLKLGAAFPGLVPRLNRLVQRVAFGPRRRLGRLHEVLPLAMPPRHFETESAVPLSAAPDVLRGLRELARRHPVNFIQELRFAPADDAWLSGAYGRATCHVGAYMAGRSTTDTAATDRYFRDFWALVREHDPRPHWGKQLEDPEGLVRRYPLGEKFRRVAAEYDPAGHLRTPFLDAVLA